MKKKYFHLFFLLLGSISCRRYVCPTYQSSLMFGTTPQSKYASLPLRDSIPFNSDERMMSAPKIFLPFNISDSSEITVKDNENTRKRTFWQKIRYALFATKSLEQTQKEIAIGKGVKWNGLISEEKSLFTLKEKKKGRNILRMVWAKATFPEEIPISPDSNTFLVFNPPKENIEQVMYEIGFKDALQKWEELGQSDLIETTDSLSDYEEQIDQEEFYELKEEDFEDLTKFREEEFGSGELENVDGEEESSNQKKHKNSLFNFFRRKKKIKKTNDEEN